MNKKEDAKRYYDAIVGDMPLTIEDLKTDLRLRHILIHHSKVSSDVPEGMDEDEFFEEILETLST